MISECTEEELARIELLSPNYITFFQKIHINEPEGAALEDIILQKTRDTTPAEERQHRRRSHTRSNSAQPAFLALLCHAG
ncbi:MAG: hypothetical protein H6564_18245 [Lewinellaceae bacterium]|nr:hypothetical protein [Lewinellaceae bacterium]